MASQSPASILAHEYGHAKTLMGSSPGVRKLRMHLYGKGPMYGTGASTLRAYGAAKGVGKSRAPGAVALQSAGLQAAGEAPRLIEEFLASYHGLKALRKFRRISPRAYRKARRDLGYAYMTYLSGAAGRVSGAALGGGLTASHRSYLAAKGQSPQSPLMDTLGLTFSSRGATGLASGIPMQYAHRKLTRGLADTPLLGRLGERALRKLMKQDLRNLQPKKGGHPLGGFFLPPTKFPEKWRKPIEKMYGKGAYDIMRNEGAISVPRRTAREIRRLSGKPDFYPGSVSDKLISIARKMQQ